jgi:hypothetical protein
MTPIKRSRRLQAGLAGLGVFSALGAAVGLGLTTPTHGSARSGDGGSTGNGTGRSHIGDGEDQGESGGTSSSPQRTQRSSPVTQPTPNPPQATTSGS